MMNKMRRRLFFLFFLSGFSVLVYEVVWARQLILIFGNTTQAVSTILAIFFAGLALGSLILGQLIDRVRKPLLVYGLLELGIGFYCFLTPFIFSKLIPLQSFLLIKWGRTQPFLLAFLVLIWPTILIGGTLPVIARFLVRDKQERGEVVGKLYGLNALGSVLGAFLAGFFLIPHLGVKETVWLAAGINLLIGAVVLVSRGKRLPVSEAGLASRKLHSTLYISNLLLVAFGLSGFAALSLEVLWTRVLILIFGSSTYAFSTILTVFLLGIALGSFLASKFLVEKENLLGWLAGLEFCLGGSVIIITPFLGKLPFFFLNFYQEKTGFTTNLWASFLTSFLVMLPPTILMGAAFPLVAKILTKNFKKLGQSLGKVYSVNTVGGIFGSLGAGFIFIPFLGLQKGILLAASFYFLAGILILSLSPLSQKAKTGVVLGVISLAAGAFFLPSWNKDVLSSGVFVYSRDYLEASEAKAEMERGRILYYKEGLSATVTVKEDRGNLYMRINGKTDASTSGDWESFLLVGHLPLLLHPEPEEILLIGLGSGITLGAVEQHPVEKIDLVEIEPAVIEGARFFASFNHQALEDERLKVFVNDGRHFLLTTQKSYDIISSHPSNPWVAGEANLFTQEYYQLAASRLKKGGLMLHWIQIYHLSPDDLKTALVTFKSVFPHVSAWLSPFSHDLLLVGGKEPLAIDFLALEKRIKEKKVQADLGGLGVNEAANLLGYFVANQEELEDFSRGAKLHTDNHPILEFSAPLALGRETIGENLEALLGIQTEPYSWLRNLNSAQKEKIEANLSLKENVFQGKIVLAKGDLENSLGYFLKAQAIDPERGQTKKELATIYFYQAEDFFAEGDFLKAKEVLIKSADLDPEQPLTHLNLGAIYFEEGNFLEAAKEWRIAQELDPERPEIKQNLELLKNMNL